MLKVINRRRWWVRRSTVSGRTRDRGMELQSRGRQLMRGVCKGESVMEVSGEASWCKLWKQRWLGAIGLVGHRVTAACMYAATVCRHC